MNWHKSDVPLFRMSKNEYLPNFIEKYSPVFVIQHIYFCLFLEATLFPRRHLEAIIWYIKSTTDVARKAAYTTTASQRCLYKILTRAPTGGGRMTAPPEISKTKQRSEKRQTAFESFGEGLQEVFRSFFR